MSHFPTFTFLGLSLFRGSITLSDNHHFHQPSSCLLLLLKLLLSILDAENRGPVGWHPCCGSNPKNQSFFLHCRRLPVNCLVAYNVRPLSQRMKLHAYVLCTLKNPLMFQGLPRHPKTQFEIPKLWVNIWDLNYRCAGHSAFEPSTEVISQIEDVHLLSHFGVSRILTNPPDCCCSHWLTLWCGLSENYHKTGFLIIEKVILSWHERIDRLRLSLPCWGYHV